MAPDDVRAGAIYSPEELDNLGSSADGALAETLQWARQYLARPHPDLGRKGPVCPFVPTALSNNVMWLTAIPCLAGDGPGAVESALDELRVAFLQRPPTEGRAAQFKTIVAVFPGITDDDAPEFIDGVQARLKPLFVEDGLMLGQFHARNDEPGLHNASFRPLRSPIPLLAIRFMVDSDLPFLTRTTDDVAVRIGFIRSYVTAYQRLHADTLDARTLGVIDALTALIAELEGIIGET